MRSFLVLTAALACSVCLSDVEPAAGQSAVLFGSCNIVQQNISVGQNATIINEVDCSPQSAEERFRLRYVWLDGLTASLIVSDYFDDSLKGLLGNSPKLIKNAIFEELEWIVRRFGYPVTLASQIFRPEQRFRVSGRGQEVLSNALKAGGIPVSILRRMKLYAGSEPILLPDLAAMREIKNSTRWPDGYDMTYAYPGAPYYHVDFRRNRVEAEASSFACTILHRMVRQTELEGYWEDIARVENAFAAKEIALEDAVHAVLSNTGEFNLIVTQNRSLDAMLHFARLGWPEDFLVAFGGVYHDDSCGYHAGIYAQPRDLFVLFAVIEAKSRFLEIEGMTFNVDRADHLRALSEGNEKQTLPAGVISLERNQSVLVPLRLELRYEKSTHLLSALFNDREAYEIYSRIRAAPIDPLRFRVKEGQDQGAQRATRIALTKPRAAFRPPQSRQIAQTYVYGQSMNLVDLKIRGETIKVRSAPANSVVMRDGWGQGSCPFLFVELGDREPRMIGRMLVGASNVEAALTERHQLPAGTTAVLLAEQEPEVTFINRISVIAEGQETELLLAERIVLRPGMTVRYEIPESFQKNSVLKITGYYAPLQPGAELASAK